MISLDGTLSGRLQMARYGAMFNSCHGAIRHRGEDGIAKMTKRTIFIAETDCGEISRASIRNYTHAIVHYFKSKNPTASFCGSICLAEKEARTQDKLLKRNNQDFVGLEIVPLRIG